MASGTKGVAVRSHRCIQDRDLHHNQVLGQLWPLSNGGIVACPLVSDHEGPLFGQYVDRFVVVRPRICMVQDLLHLQDLGQRRRHILLRGALTHVHKRFVYERLRQFQSLKGNGFKVVDKVTRFQQGVYVSKESVQTIFKLTVSQQLIDDLGDGFPLRGVNIGKDSIVEL